MQDLNREGFLKYAQYNDELLKIEEKIKQYVETHKEDEEFCANKAWYLEPNFKQQICREVGEFSENNHPKLKSSIAYDVVCDYLYELLPPCKHERPFC